MSVDVQFQGVELPEPEDPECVMQAAVFVRCGDTVLVFVTWCESAVRTRVGVFKLVTWDCVEEVTPCLPIPQLAVSVKVTATPNEPAVLITVSGLYEPECQYLVDVCDMSVTPLAYRPVRDPGAGDADAGSRPCVWEAYCGQSLVRPASAPSHGVERVWWFPHGHGAPHFQRRPRPAHAGCV